jgi:predicted acetyltransferase
LLATAERSIDPEQKIELLPATREQQPLLANLLELYAHDFSEFLHLELDEEARFGYADLPLYWSQPDFHPFLVRIEGKPAGFVLVRKGSRVSRKENVWDMAEFFVVRGYRRHGAGTRAAHEVWRRFPGAWEIRVAEANASAHRFWAHAIETFSSSAVVPSRFEKNGAGWRLFSFSVNG